MLYSAALNIGVGSTGAATFFMRGSTTLSGDISSGQTVWVQGCDGGSNATLTTAAGFTNAGTIRLESANQGYSDTLTVSSGTLTNTAGGIILVNNGSGGSRTINASITNQGTITTNAALLVNGSGRVFDQAGGSTSGSSSLTLTGGTFVFQGGSFSTAPLLTNVAVNISAGATDSATLVVRGSSTLSGTVAPSQTIWVQGSDAGGNTTLTTSEGAVNQGTILLQSINQGYTSSLSIGGSSFVNASSGIITVNGGSGGTRSISGHLVNQGTVNANTFLTFTGIYTSAGGTLNGSAYLVNAQIEETAAPSAPTTLMLWGKSTLATDNLANTTLWVQGSDGGGNATMTSATGFTNAGTIRLESVNQGYSDTLAVSSGTLTTAAGGIILVNNDTGGGRVISGNVFNQGTITVNAGTTLTVSRTGGPSFTQVAGTITGSGEFDLSGGVFNFNGGTVVGTTVLYSAALNIGVGSTGAATFFMRGSTTLSGDISSGQTVWVQGCDGGSNATLTTAAGFTNAGTIRLESANQGYSDTLTVSSGTLTNAAGGIILVNNGSGGSRTINAGITNQGTITTNAALLVNGSGRVFDQAGGSTSGSSSLTLTGGTFVFQGGSFSTAPLLTNVAVNISAGATDSATLVVRGSSTLSGTVAPSQTIWVQGSDAGGNTTLTTSEGAVNQGTILLQSINQGYTSSLSIGGSSFVNASSGIITVNGGSGGTRSISGHLVNQGTVNANTFLTLTGTYTSAGGTLNGSAYLVNAQIEETAAPTSPTTLVLWGKSTLTTDNLANTTLWVQGSDGGSNATLTAANSFSNSGTILLESVNTTYTDALVLQSGTLTNAAGGTLDVLPVPAAFVLSTARSPIMA